MCPSKFFLWYNSLPVSVFVISSVNLTAKELFSSKFTLCTFDIGYDISLCLGLFKSILRAVDKPGYFIWVV